MKNLKDPKLLNGIVCYKNIFYVPQKKKKAIQVWNNMNDDRTIPLTLISIKKSCKNCCSL